MFHSKRAIASAGQLLKTIVKKGILFGNLFGQSVFAWHSLVLRQSPQRNTVRPRWLSLSSSSSSSRKSSVSTRFAAQETSATTSQESNTFAKSALPMNFVNGIRDIADRYDLFLLDMWGVLHDGSTPYEGVLDAIRRLKQAGKELIILSNSSKRNSHSVSSLRKLGFQPDDFQQIITSGELAFQMLAGATKRAASKIAASDTVSWPLLDQLIAGGPSTTKVLLLGSGDGDAEYCQSCGWTLASIKEATLILARGTFTINDGSTNHLIEKKQDEARYEQALAEILQEAAKRRLPMLVSNPDKIRPDKERPPMPGAIGDAYEQALGGGVAAEELVKRVGKPFRDVYDVALARTQAGVGDLSRVCMVGDALETDVTGGSAVGIDTIWIIKDGIHGPDVDEKGEGSFRLGASRVLEQFNGNPISYAKGKQLKPTAVMPHFRW